MGATTWTNRARVNVIDDGTTLADTVRAAADYDNNSNKDLSCNVFITVQWNTTAPADGVKFAQLYIIPGDGAATEVFAVGGDAGLGVDVTPQKILLVGVVEAVSASITVDREYTIPGVPLYHSGNRFVLLNTSGFEFDATWQLDIVPYTITTAT